MTRAASTTLLTLLVLAACGGGGAGPGPSDGPGFHGTYGFLLLEWAQADEYVRSTIGTMTPDGAGGVTLADLHSTEAGTDKTAALPPMTYVEESGGRVVLIDRIGRRFTADISSTDAIVAGTTREGGTQPALLVLVHRDASFTLADLAGDWMEVAWGRDRETTEEGDYAWALDQEIEAGGSMFTDGGPENRFEVYSFIPTIPDATSTVEVLGGGLLAWERPFDGLTTHLGTVSSDDRIMLLGGEYASLKTSGTLCVRRGQPVESSQLVGTYWMNGIGSTALGHHVRYGTATFAADGTGTSSFDHNVEGIIFGPGSDPFDWGYVSDGKVSVEWGGDAVPLHGIAGAGGAYVILAGGFENGVPAELHVLLR